MQNIASFEYLPLFTYEPFAKSICHHSCLPALSETSGPTDSSVTTEMFTCLQAVLALMVFLLLHCDPSWSFQASPHHPNFFTLGIPGSNPWASYLFCHPWTLGDVIQCLGFRYHLYMDSSQLYIYLLVNTKNCYLLIITNLVVENAISLV